MKNTIPEFDFENYKVNFCKNPVCKFFSEDHLFLTYSECSDYHTQDDRRRKVVINENSFNYSPKYYYDSNDNNCADCRNSFEFYYHPLNYKSKKCEKPKCNENYCPFFHKTEEKEEFQNYRKRFTNIKFQTIFDSVLQLCQQINENLKITDNNGLKLVEESPEKSINLELIMKKKESNSSIVVKKKFKIYS